MKGGYLIGRHRAIQDWLLEGAFSNPYAPNTPESDGYNSVVDDQERIDDVSEQWIEERIK